MERKLWTTADIEYLTERYGNTPIDNLMHKLSRTKSSIHKKARKLHLKSKKNPKFHIHGFRLLDDSLETLYWTGFIMADGTIENNNRIKIRIAEQDKTHLEKFAKYLNTKIVIQNKQKSAKVNHQRQVRVDYSDNNIVNEYCKKYDIKNRKSYNPPNLSNLKLSDEQLLALFIGYIDGDGSIRRRKNSYELSIIVHSNWLDTLLFLDKKLKTILNLNISSKPRITGREQAALGLSSVPLRKLKKFILNNNLPAMERKWDIIDHDYLE